MPRPKVENPVQGGSDAMRRAGKKPILLTATPAEHARIKEAIDKVGGTMKDFALNAALREAERILGKKRK